MKISNNKVEGVHYQDSPNQGGAVEHAVIIMHDTAGPSLASARDWFAQSAAKASAHFIIGRDGEIIQMVPLNHKAWHAGASSWKGRQNVNSFGIGIELVNPGLLKKIDNDTFKPWYRGTVENHKSPGTLAGEVRQGGIEYRGVKWSGYWLDYTDFQMKVAGELVAALRQEYRIPKANVGTHWMISPGRKVDTNPLFQMDRLLGNAVPDAHTTEAEPVGKAAKVKQTLNLREWPSLYATNVIKSLPRGSAVVALKTGTYEKIGDGITPDGTHIKWTQVRVGGIVGWVMDQYLERVE